MYSVHVRVKLQEPEAMQLRPKSEGQGSAPGDYVGHQHERGVARRAVAIDD